MFSSNLRLSAFGVNGNLADIVVAFSALVITLILTILRVIAMCRGSMGRDFVMLGIHVLSVLSAIGFMVDQSEFNMDELALCRIGYCLQGSAEYLRRILALCIYWLRLNAFIGPIYPTWLRYLTMLPTVLLLIFPCLVFNECGKALAAVVDGACWFMQTNSLSSDRRTLEIFVSLLGLISVVYLSLFIFPLVKYQDDVLIRTIRKHVLITGADIIVELPYLAVVCGSEHIGFSEYSSSQIILYFELIYTNVILIFVFADWRKYLCITDRCKNQNEDHVMESLSARQRISFQTGALEEKLVS